MFNPPPKKKKQNPDKNKLTELGYGRIELRGSAAPGIQLLDLGRGHRLVGLTSGSVHGLHP